jgi:hypothetical protein
VQSLQVFISFVCKSCNCISFMFKYEFLNGQLFSYSYKLFMFNSYLPHYAPCFSFFIGQSTFSRNVCHVQASSNGNNGLLQHCDMAQQWHLFISCIIHSISLASLFFSSYKSFSSSHTHFVSWLFHFFSNHS